MMGAGADDRWINSKGDTQMCEFVGREMDKTTVMTSLLHRTLLATYS